MYHKFFDLKEPAFSIAVNPRFLYMSKQHREALIHLLFGVKGGGFVCLTGEVGTGKTTIIQRLIKRLPENTDIAIVLNPMADAADMLYTICDELKVDYQNALTNAQALNGGRRESLKPVYDALNAFLLKNHRDGRNTVLLIDEAQLLNPESLEQVRLLTNLETTTKKLLQIILVGQPELNALLAEPQLRQLSQRITARFHLRALNYEATEAYIQHRWTVAGGDLRKLPFVPNAIKAIHSMSEGIPRKINLLCERALIGAYAHNQVVITHEILKLARKEVLGDPDGLPKKKVLSTSAPLTASSHFNPWIAGLIALCVSLLILVAFLIFKTKPDPVSAAVSTKPSATQQPLASTNSNSRSKSPAVSSTNVATTNAIADSQRASNILPTDAADPNIRADMFFQSRQDAFRALTQYLGFGDSADTICDDALYPTVACERGTVSSWQQLLAFNRPALLTLVTPDKFLYYTVLISVDGDDGLFVTQTVQSERYAAGSIADKAIRMPLSTIGNQWNGEYAFTWRRPPGFSKSISAGQSSPAVAWIAKQFALLDNQEQVLATSRYNQKLEQRIKIFQREHNLTPDGIVGELTLLKLNAVLEYDQTLTGSP